MLDRVNIISGNIDFLVVANNSYDTLLLNIHIIYMTLQKFKELEKQKIELKNWGICP